MVLNRSAPSPLRAADQHSRGWEKAHISWRWTTEGSVSTVWGGGTQPQALLSLGSDFECAIAHGQTNGWLSLWQASSYKNIYDSLKNKPDSDTRVPIFSHENKTDFGEASLKTAFSCAVQVYPAFQTVWSWPFGVATGISVTLCTYFGALNSDKDTRMCTEIFLSLITVSEDTRVLLLAGEHLGGVALLRSRRCSRESGADHDMRVLAQGILLQKAVSWSDFGLSDSCDRLSFLKSYRVI